MVSLQFAKTVFMMFYTTTMIAFTSLQLMGFHQASSQSNTDVLSNAHYFFYQNSEYPKDCRDVQRQCSTQISSGVYLIKPDGFHEPFEAFCDNGTDSGGWTVIQRREDGIVNVNRSWTEYRDGFGFLSTEFFIGNEKMAYLTNQADYELLIEAELEDGCSFYTSYKGFRITDEFGQYKLQHIGSFEGNASLCLNDCPANEFFINECTEKCVCSNNNLETCRTVTCDDNAFCDTSTGVETCSCQDDFEGDGLTCTEIMTTTTPPPLYTDCKEVFDNGNTQDGVYTISPNGWTGSPFNVFCDMSNGGGGWTVFQRRKDDSTSFYQDWDSYKEGFGDENENFWLGNEKLFYLTNQKNYQLRLDIVTAGGASASAEWTEFQIRNESDNYRMNKLGTRSGNAGYYLSYNRDKQFSTYDRDNDQCDNYDCAEQHMSGWWHYDAFCSGCYTSTCGCSYFPSTTVCSYGDCTLENLNGLYNGGNGQGIFSFWYGGCSNIYCNPQHVELKIRPSP